MIDFVLEAEKLMAATAPGKYRGLGISLEKWRKDYGQGECVQDQRNFIAAWLRRFAGRVSADVAGKRIQKVSRKGRRPV